MGILSKNEQILGVENDGGVGINGLSIKEMTELVVAYTTSAEQVASLNSVDRGLIKKEAYLNDLLSYVIERFHLENDMERAKQVVDNFERFMWSYYILDELIADKAISDIRVTAWNQIYFKKYGKRQRSTISFLSPEDYDRFIERVALKNKINLSDQNAIQIFTDVSQPDWRLRFNISTKFITNSGCPYLHIRKLPKKKVLLPELVSKHKMLSPKQAEYLSNLVKNNESILFCGAGGSGKTTIMNALFEYIDNRSIYCIQESDEIFMEQDCEFMNYHVVTNRGEGKINYTLGDLAPFGLVCDIDTFIIGEIKGKEALDFLTTVFTGATGYGSVHAPSEDDAYTRVADLVRRASDYTNEEIFNMLKKIDNVVFMKNYKVCGISKATWDNEKKVFHYDHIMFDDCNEDGIYVGDNSTDEDENYVDEAQVYIDNMLNKSNKKPVAPEIRYATDDDYLSTDNIISSPSLNTNESADNNDDDDLDYDLYMDNNNFNDESFKDSFNDDSSNN